MDLQAITEGLAAGKGALDLMRLAIATVRDATGLLPDSQSTKAAIRALDEAEKAASIAEAQLAQALGYPLCRCTFPPAIMLRVGWRMTVKPHSDKTLDVHECPRCGQTDYPGMHYQRFPVR